MDTQPIDWIRELLTVAESGELGELGDWLAPRLDDYLTNAQNGTTLDQALRLATSPGQAPWWRFEAQRARDNAIRRLADQHFSSLDLNGQADAIIKAIGRYRNSRWRFDKFKGCVPENYADTRSEHLYTVLRKGGGAAPEDAELADRGA